MQGPNRRPSMLPPASKRPSAAEKPPAATAAAAQRQQANKRMALGNITNLGSAGRNPSRLLGPKTATKTKPVNSTLTTKKGYVKSSQKTGFTQNSIIASAVKPSSIVPIKANSITKNDGPPGFLVPCRKISTPVPSIDSRSLEESMSTCDSLRSPEFEYIDNVDSSRVASLEKQATNHLHITDNAHCTDCIATNNIAVTLDNKDHIVDVDDNHDNPQYCATLAYDIYYYLRITESKKMPSTDYMEKVQKDISASMRAILVDWLVEVAEEYCLVPDTLYLTIYYIDQYLSGNEINRQRLQLLGVSCMLIASKYEEICAPQVDEFCYITDNTYFKDEVIQMEAAILKFLKFEMTAPTVTCFLRRFILAAKRSDENLLNEGLMQNSELLLLLECLSKYIAELSLLEYSFLCYPPSLVAASSVFLAKYILQPTKKPWNATLHHYTLYRQSELHACVKALHGLVRNSHNCSLPAIREKYTHHKYKAVAKKFCPPFIPFEFFQD